MARPKKIPPGAYFAPFSAFSGYVPASNDGADGHYLRRRIAILEEGSEGGMFWIAYSRAFNEVVKFVLQCRDTCQTVPQWKHTAEKDKIGSSGTDRERIVRAYSENKL